MRIGINAALLGSGPGYRQTGVSRYIGELITAIDAQLPDPDKLVVFRGGFGPIARRPSLRILWEQTMLSPAALIQRLDVFHGPLNVAPMISRIPTVVTVHDLAFLRYPDQLPRARRTYMVAATRISVKRSRLVIAVSQNTAADLQHWLKIGADRIRVIPEAPSSAIERVTGTSLDVFRMRSASNRPYLLAVGTREPRKNLPFLVQVFATIKDRIPHDLVLVGPEGWLTGELRDTIEELDLGDRLRMTGFVTDRDLGGWYSAADCLVYPSLYEGFGLPTVEAMTCATPVITSTTSCFPEVVGDAGMMVDPHDSEGWANAIVRLTEDRALNNQLRNWSVARASVFTWQRTARETIDVYREACS